MKVAVLKTVYHDKLGKLTPGRIVDIPDNWARTWLRAGAVERYETKVIREVPLPIAGVEELSSASPAGQALPQTTLKPSKRGGRKKKAAQ